MRDTSKKILSVAAAAVLGSTLLLGGCGATAYKGDALDGYVSEATVESNGGFAVRKGDFVYFINGYASHTGDNTYGVPEKGALMRISVADLNAGNYAKVKTVVPSLFTAQDYTSGIYIFGDYVYYATPTTNKDVQTGELSNGSLDFKRASIKGDAAPMDDYYFRLSSNSSKYRFTEVDGVVYCMYEEDGNLKSFNTSTRKTSVLVSGASTYYYDQTNLDSPYVYYTMSVKDVDKENPSSYDYTQLYCVTADTTATADANTAKVSVSNGVEYEFDVNYFNEYNAENKDSAYDLSDYSSYPYVNLGSLVLDGVGSQCEETMFNTNGNVGDASTSNGYKYTISSVQNGGVYFTRSNVTTNSTTSPLYYVANATSSASAWNAVTGNDAVETVADDSTSLTGAYLYKNNDAHAYLYKKTVGSATHLVRHAKNASGVYEDVTLTKDVADATLWKLIGDTLYYYDTKTNDDSSTNGKNLTMIRIEGSRDDYNIEQNFGGDANSSDFAPVIVPLVDWDSAWYAPEIFEDTVLYVNQQTFGANYYKYIYAAKIDAATAKSNIEAVEAVNDAIEESELSTTQAVLKYYYRTGLTTAYDNVKDLYSESAQNKIQEFINKFTGEDALKLENKVVSIVGKMTADDEKKVADEWRTTLKTETTTDEQEGLPTWAIVLIIVGGVLVVAAAVLVPLLVVSAKKKAKKAEEEATVNAYKRKKIDTTDDKSIDVYADETTETVAEEGTEEVVAEAEESAETQDEE